MWPRGGEGGSGSVVVIVVSDEDWITGTSGEHTDVHE